MDHGGRNPWRMSLHIHFLIVFQICIIILYGIFARYDPMMAYRSKFPEGAGEGHGAPPPPPKHQDGAMANGTAADHHEMHKEILNVERAHHLIGKLYPMFQDVHVMIFIGFGFLMTFLKRYGLSAVSLNMLVSAMAIEWSILINGWFHRHCEEPTIPWSECPSNIAYVDINLLSMINADFATAAILISFGVVIGTTTPLQLLVMVLIEIVLYNVNEVIGRSYLGTVDAGDTIFVHMFGAYFGLAASRVLYDRANAESEKAGASYTSDLFSMIGTIFLWMFWPSFNAGTAAEGDAQMRALINTYLSLCACVMTSFAISALVDSNRKFCMEHIQNATLAGGVAVGACADMVITPVGAIIIGSFAGIISTCGFRYLTPYLRDRWNICDTCGVNNLHGMPSLLGGFISVLIAGIANDWNYDRWTGDADKSLTEIFPGIGTEPGWTSGYQAAMQIAGIAVTLGIAIVGGAVTGLIMKIVGRLTSENEKARSGKHLVLNPSPGEGSMAALAEEYLYDDAGYFHVEP